MNTVAEMRKRIEELSMHDPLVRTALQMQRYQEVSELAACMALVLALVKERNAYRNMVFEHLQSLRMIPSLEIEFDPSLRIPREKEDGEQTDQRL